MKDRLQNVSFDRWLMRGKDILQILGTIFVGIWVTIQVIHRIDSLISGLEHQRQAITKMQIELKELKDSKR